MRVEQCEVCRAECPQCKPLDFASREVASELGIDDIDGEWEFHYANGHPINLDGALWRCIMGHTVEASGIDVMEAAGARRLL